LNTRVPRVVGINKLMESRFGMWKKLLLLSAAVAPLFAQIPSVFIDGPLQGANVTGTITVSGWAIDNTQNIGTPITSVIVKVDGITMGAATTCITSPCLSDPAT